MWFKSGTFTGLGTDAWLSNYAIGIGSTQVPNGVRLAVGNVKITENDLSVVRNINASGVITATSFVGIVTYASTAGIATSVIGGIASVTSLSVSGISTFTNGPLLIGSGTSTGTASQPLQVTGGAYVSGNTGIGTTVASVRLTVLGNTANVLIGNVYTNANGITLNGSTASTDYNILSSSTNNLVINRPSGKTILFAQADSTHATFDTSNNLQLNSGSLAIGNFTPSYALDAGAATLNKAGRVGSIIFGTAGTSYGIVGYNAKPSGLNSWTYDVTDVASWVQFLSGGHVFYRAISGTVGALITPLESGRFDSSGNLLIGSSSATGTASQPLQVTGGAYISQSVGIGTTNPTDKLTVSGNVNITGVTTASSFVRSGGTSSQFLKADGSVDSNVYATDSPSFYTGITTSIYVSVTSGVGTNTIQTNDIFAGPGIAGTTIGIAYSFPSTAGKKYVIESIHLTNTFSDDVYFVGRQDYSGGSAVPIAQRIIIPYQGALELLESQIVANPSDILRFQALSGVGTTAVGLDGALDAFVVYSEKNDTNYIGTGKTVTNSSGTEIFQASTYPAMVQSIEICNYNMNIDVDASVSIYRGGTAGGIVTTGVRQGYLAYNVTVPKNSVIEIIGKPKYLAVNDSIVGGASTANSVSIRVSGKYIS